MNTIYKFWHKKSIFYFFLLFLLFGFFIKPNSSSAQYVEKKEKEQKSNGKSKGYIDYKPIYQTWQKSYILDKIEYRPQRTVLHFRYLGEPPTKSERSRYQYNPVTKVSLFGAGRDSSWCIANPNNPRENFSMIEVRNVRRNGEMVYERLEDRQIIDFSLKAQKYEVITCEIHFPKLPNDIKIADLLEGWRYKEFTNHFHCLNIQLKTENEDIGTYQDMVTRINRFEQGYFGWARSEQAQILPPEFPEQDDKKEDKLTLKEDKKNEKKEEKKKEEKKKKERPAEAQAQIRDEDFLQKNKK